MRNKSGFNEHEEEVSFQANLLQSVHDAIAAVDENHIITYWNHMAEKMFGWTKEDVIGRSSDIIFGVILPSLPRQIDQINDDLYFDEVVYCNKDDIPLFAAVHIRALKDNAGRSRGYAAAFRDITEHKQLELQLKTSRDKYQSLIETNVDFIWEVDAKGRFMYCSPQMEQLWGFKPVSMIGKSPFERMPAHAKEYWMQQFEKATKYAGQFKTIQTTSADMNGDIIYLETNGVPFYDNEGTLAGYRGITRDITESKKSEIALQKLVSKLQKADEHKNAFLGSLSHELRNPLASIMMGISLIEHNEIEGKSSLHTVEIMKRQISQLSGIVDDLLDVTRIKNNKIKLKKDLIELNQVVSNIAADYRYQFINKGIELKVELSKQKLYLEADHTRITQAMANLLGNALKFTERGGSVGLKLRLDTNYRQAVISVKDSGVGIPSDLMPDLFEPFVQADKTLERSGGGLGLGLAIVKGIVELHNGSICALSGGLEKGSEFIVKLPVII